MSDVLFLLLTAVVFAAAWGLVIGCERLLDEGDEPLDESSADPAADRAPVGAA